MWNYQIVPLIFFLVWIHHNFINDLTPSRCGPEHWAVGLRKEPQSHPTSGGLWLRYEAIRSRSGQCQSQPSLSSWMDRYVLNDFILLSGFYFCFTTSYFGIFYWLWHLLARYQRTSGIRAWLWSAGSFPRGSDQLVRFPLPTGIHSGSSHIGFLPPGQELRPRHLHRPGKTYRLAFLLSRHRNAECVRGNKYLDIFFHGINKRNVKAIWDVWYEPAWGRWVKPIVLDYSSENM